MENPIFDYDGMDDLELALADELDAEDDDFPIYFDEEEEDEE